MAAVSQDNDSPEHQTNTARELGDPWQFESISAELIDSPLDFIAANHQRQRQAAVILDLISDGGFDSDGIKRLIGYFEDDFVLEIADEEIDLFPVLRRVCQPEDNVDALIGRLTEENKRDETKTANIVSILKGLITGDKLNAKTIRAIRDLAEDILQHVTLENAVLLPIARVRMKADTLSSVALAFKERRSSRQ